MPTTTDTAKLLRLKAQCDALSGSDQLRLAAGLIDQGEYTIAETLASNVVNALRARRLLRNDSKPAPAADAVARDAD